MREILFRGKRKNFSKPCGKWIEGYLSVLFPTDMPKRYAKEKTVIMPTGAECNWFNKFLYDVIEVIPETVGQYTGLTDKNGKKIFEGDIIKSDNGRISAISIVQYGNFEPKMFYDLLERYVRPRPKEKMCGLFAKSTKGEEFLISECSHLIEVIGNIHDNPELIKGGAE